MTVLFRCTKVQAVKPNDNLEIVIFISINASSLTIIEFKHFCLTKRLNTKKKSCQRRTGTKNNFFLQKKLSKTVYLTSIAIG